MLVGSYPAKILLENPVAGTVTDDGGKVVLNDEDTVLSRLHVSAWTVPKPPEGPPSARKNNPA